MTQSKLEVPWIWRIERCTKHENYESDCLSCREEILTIKTENAYRAGFKAALTGSAGAASAELVKQLESLPRWTNTDQHGNHLGTVALGEVLKLVAVRVGEESRETIIEDCCRAQCNYCRWHHEGGRWSAANSNGKHFDAAGIEAYCQAYEIRRALADAPKQE